MVSDDSRKETTSAGGTGSGTAGTHGEKKNKKDKGDRKSGAQGHKSQKERSGKYWTARLAKKRRPVRTITR